MADLQRLKTEILAIPSGEVTPQHEASGVGRHQAAGATGKAGQEPGVADDSEGDLDGRVLTDEEALALDEKVRRGEELSPQDRQAWLAYHARRQRQGPKRWRPWTAAEDLLVRTLPPQEVARRTGRSLPAVYTRRGTLRGADGGRQE
jgi:hypothetical protein